MTVRIDEHGCLIVGNCALPAAVVPAVEAFYREQFERACVVAEEPEWEYGYTSKWGTITASSQADAESRAADHARGIADRRESGDLTYHGKVVKRIARSKAGPWVPVEQEGERDA